MTRLEKWKTNLLHVQSIIFQSSIATLYSIRTKNATRLALILRDLALRGTQSSHNSLLHVLLQTLNFRIPTHRNRENIPQMSIHNNICIVLKPAPPKSVILIASEIQKTFTLRRSRYKYIMTPFHYCIVYSVETYKKHHYFMHNRQYACFVNCGWHRIIIIAFAVSNLI